MAAPVDKLIIQNVNGGGVREQWARKMGLRALLIVQRGWRRELGA
jgi:hypothetical protein